MRWSSRPWTSRVLRVGIVIGPIATSFGAAWALSSLITTPTTIAGAVARWLAVAVAATAVLAVTDRLARRLSPLAVLLDLTLTFPDRAPSRFRLALRNGSGRQLQARIDDARRGVVGDTPQKAAERVLALVAALNVHDRITRGHSERVRAYSHTLGKELGLDERELDRLQWAGLLHDVGKLLVPAAILSKVGPLTEREHDIVRRHPMDGRGLVAPLVGWLGQSSRAVWEHHERWDGGGYPAGLAGTDIALAARIVAVADAFDVMTSARSYKQPIPSAQARAELARCAGTHFDPTVVRAFLNISVPRLCRATGPVSWLAQAALFPTSVLSSAAGGTVATVAATLVAAGTLGGGAVDNAAAPTATTEQGDDVGSGEPGTFRRPVEHLLIVTTSTIGVPTTTIGAGPAPPPTPIATTTTEPPATTAPIGPPAPTVTTVPATTSTTPVTMPPLTVPPTTQATPAITLPPATVPPLAPPIATLVPGLPSVTVPSVTLPSLSIPPLTLPTATIPTLTVPTLTIPILTVPPLSGQ